MKYRVNLLDYHTEEIVRTSRQSFDSYDEAEYWGKEQCSMFPEEITYEVTNEDGTEVQHD